MPGWHLRIALPLAALAVAATIDSLNLRAFYWLSGSVRYALSSAVLTMFVALAAHSGGGGGGTSRGRLMALSISSCAVCFVNAGLSELYMLFQLGLLALAAAVSAFALKRSVRPPFVAAFGFGWLGTAAALVAQITSPGVLIRAQSIQSHSSWTPTGSLAGWLNRVAAAAYDILVQSEVIIAIMLMFFAGLATALLWSRAEPGCAAKAAVNLPKPPLYIALLAQLFVLPGLWAHSSDQAQFFGRFSPGLLCCNCAEHRLYCGHRRAASQAECAS